MIFKKVTEYSDYSRDTEYYRTELKGMRGKTTYFLFGVPVYTRIILSKEKE